MVEGVSVWVPESGAPADESRYGPVRGEEALERLARRLLVADFQARGVPLERALDELRSRSERWAEVFGYEPMMFVTRYSLKRMPVTLEARQSSIHSICQMLADQVGGELEYRNGMVQIGGCPYTIGTLTLAQPMGMGSVE